VARLVVPVFRDAVQAVLAAQESSAPTITGDALKLSASSLSARISGRAWCERAAVTPPWSGRSMRPAAGGEA
jgi:hypothetical protein